MIYLARIPDAAGFIGKLSFLATAVESGMCWMVVLALIASASGFYYYSRVIVVMYMSKLSTSGGPVAIPDPVCIVIGVMVAGTFYLGLLPDTVLNLASKAVRF